MHPRSLLLTVVLLISVILLNAQDRPVHPSTIATGTFIGISKPLRDLPKMTQEDFNRLALKAKNKQLNESLKLRSYPFASTALPKGPDPVWQKTMGASGGSRAPIANFNGQDSPYYPPDCNGVAGPSHYMQTINCVYAIYTKSGTLVAGPTDMNLLFGSVPGASYNDGDPVVLYDEQAGRWVATEFSISGSSDYILMAVSTTSDPTGTWYQYSFPAASMPDYPKFGIWRDGYYMADNNSSGNDIYVYQRSQMLIGGTAQSIGFDNPYRPTSIDGFMMVPPVDNDGTFAPTGAPGTFIAVNDDAIGGGSDQLWIYELSVNWTTPSSSTFNRVQTLNVAAFSSDFGTTWNNIAQSGTTQKVDAIPQVIMNVPQYRNFGTYQTIVCCHTVDIDATDHAGIRWYELRRGTQTSGNWAVRQQGTYAPDAHSRWMGSIMLNGNGKIGLGYSISSSSLFPGIRYCGQSSTAYNSASGNLDLPEEIIHTGAYSQTGANRWGDYSNLSIDPTDDNTFWFTTQYIGSGSTRKTKIASFKFSNPPAVTTLAATSVTVTSAVLNGTVNPNGMATNYYFEWGLTTSYGNTTTSTPAGSGTSNVSVNASISGLTSGSTYHFRLVAINSDGTSNGSDLTLTPGAATVTTTAASGITSFAANSGGNVTNDGGLTVTARGVCWSTSANPTIANSHTSDGSGTGVFTSYLSGLTPNTTYHIRAYATNSGGTYYGDDLTFTTLCITISSFPWNEGFENAGAIPNCWTQEQVASSGIYFTFITGNGASNPATAHGGTYNACLKDNTTADNKTKLITPKINLSAISSPTLTFWHTQAVSSTRQDQLAIYYKNSAGGTWTLITTYTASVTAWTQRTISLPNSSSDYYIAFEGNAKYGRGVCIDDVAITGTPVTPTLDVTPLNQSVTASAGSTSFTVTSNSSWTATSDQTWCTVTPSGSGNGTITANYTANSLFTSRVANITVTVTGLTPKVVTVTQAAATPSLSVTPSNQDVSPAAGSTTFTVTSNSSWTVSSNQTWCTPTLSGSGNGIITANFTVNNTASSRVASLTVTVSGLSPVIVTVTQAAPTLAVAPLNQDVTYTAGNTSFNVTSNTAWTASSDQSWCTVTPSGSGSGTISADYTENPTYITRTAIVTVTVTGLSPVTVTVTQAGTPVPEFNYTIANDIQTSDRTLEFDLYLLDTQTETPFELSIIQAGILMNSGIINGGTISVSILSGSSELVPLQQPTTVIWATGTPNGCIKITPKAAPGCGSGTIISTTGSGTKICRVRITNTVPFTGGSQANLAFNFTTSPYPTKIFQYVGTPCSSVQQTTNSTNCFSLASNPVLNGPPSLSVSPSDQPVNAPAGTIPFIVTSNTNWTAVSNQTWCTVTPSGFGNGTITANFTEHTDPSPRIATITVSASGVTPVLVTVTQSGASTKTFNLTVFLEGLYIGSNSMNPAMDENGYHWGPTIADKINIELHDGTNYPDIIYTASDVTLNTNGTATVPLSSAYSGNYYVTITQRNHILTTTAFPVSFNTPSISYNFDSPAKAYGGNMLLMIDGKYVFFAGDVNQDYLVDGSDLSDIDNLSNIAAGGYIPEDVNGDGLIDGSDLSIAGNNADIAAGAVTP